MFKKYKSIMKNSKKGYTLLEIIVTVVIIGIAATASLAILWTAITTHDTLSNVSINSQISSNTMHYIHYQARNATSAEVVNTARGRDNLTILNTDHATAKDKSLAIFARKDADGKFRLNLAVKKSSGWIIISEFDEGVDKAEFEVVTTALSGSSGADNVKFKYKFSSEKNVVYDGGVIMQNITNINYAHIGGSTVEIDLINDTGADSKILLLET